jgi:CrcB protein
MKFVWIALGGAMGAIARYSVGVWVYERVGTRFPYGTLVINVTGCFLMGLAMSLLDSHLDLNPAWRYAVPVGFIGAYTTFSTFEYETLHAMQNGQVATAFIYFAGSLVMGFVGVWLGMQFGRVFA